MKIVTPKQMLQIESKAFREGYNEDEFMEDAGKGVARVVDDFVQRNELNKQAVLLCGKGNNAGDAYVAGIHLIKMGYEVFAFQIIPKIMIGLLRKRVEFKKSNPQTILLSLSMGS
jgi:ADP-dependent NAD(P)H-hydrate dehydratase / NAD(P)H-hydrate epimerase